MRRLILLVLAAFPVALVSWVFLRGRAGAPPERLGLERVGASFEEQGVRAATSTRAPTKSPIEEPGPALAQLFAGSLAGARISAKLELYDPARLYDYIDGAAPMYLERKFRLLGAAELAAPGGGELTCDVYDMTDAEHARSIAAAEKSPAAKAVEAWPDSWSGPMSFVFQRDRFYVKLTAFDAKAERFLPQLARALAERIP